VGGAATLRAPLCCRCMDGRHHSARGMSHMPGGSRRAPVHMPAYSTACLPACLPHLLCHAAPRQADGDPDRRDDQDSCAGGGLQ
jgi:hypothetical protein